MYLYNSLAGVPCVDDDEDEWRAALGDDAIAKGKRPVAVQFAASRGRIADVKVSLPLSSRGGPVPSLSFGCPCLTHARARTHTHPAWRLRARALSLARSLQFSPDCAHLALAGHARVIDVLAVLGRVPTAHKRADRFAAVAGKMRRDDTAHEDDGGLAAPQLLLELVHGGGGVLALCWCPAARSSSSSGGDGSSKGGGSSSKGSKAKGKGKGGKGKASSSSSGSGGAGGEAASAAAASGDGGIFAAAAASGGLGLLAAACADGRVRIFSVPAKPIEEGTPPRSFKNFCVLLNQDKFRGRSVLPSIFSASLSMRAFKSGLTLGEALLADLKRSESSSLALRLSLTMTIP